MRPSRASRSRLRVPPPRSARRRGSCTARSTPRTRSKAGSCASSCAAGTSARGCTARCGLSSCAQHCDDHVLHTREVYIASAWAMKCETWNMVSCTLIPSSASLHISTITLLPVSSSRLAVRRVTEYIRQSAPPPTMQAQSHPQNVRRIAERVRLAPRASQSARACAQYSSQGLCDCVSTRDVERPVRRTEVEGHPSGFVQTERLAPGFGHLGSFGRPPFRPKGAWVWPEVARIAMYCRASLSSAR
jgi:hypothetical protein